MNIFVISMINLSSRALAIMSIIFLAQLQMNIIYAEPSALYIQESGQIGINGDDAQPIEEGVDVEINGRAKINSLLNLSMVATLPEVDDSKSGDLVLHENGNLYVFINGAWKGVGGVELPGGDDPEPEPTYPNQLVDAVHSNTTEVEDADRGAVYRFDGDDESVLELELNHENATIMFWVKTTQTAAGLMFATLASNYGANDRNIYFNGTTLSSRIWSSEVIHGPAILNDDNWHHVVFTYGQEVGGQNLYLDGELIAQGVKSFSNFNWQTHIVIGKSNRTSATFVGDMDDLHIFDRSLSAEEIGSIYTEELVGESNSNPPEEGQVDLLESQSGASRTQDSDRGEVTSFNGDTFKIDKDVNEDEATVSFWVKYFAGSSYIYRCTSTTGGYDREIYLSSDGVMRSRIWSIEVITSEVTNVADGEWHHVVRTYGPSIGGQKIYLDGVEIVSGNKTFSNFHWQNQIELGHSTFVGSMDDLHIFDRAYTSAEVDALYQSQK